MWDIGTHAPGNGVICNLGSYILKVAKEDCPKGRNNDLGGPTPSFLTQSFVIIEATTLGLMGCVASFWFLLDCSQPSYVQIKGSSNVLSNFFQYTQRGNLMSCST
jgi:hypothetical protein